MSSSKLVCQYDISGTGTGTEIYLNYDLMLQVLVRLPIKSLIKFKSVCTSWNSVISSVEFANLHQQHVNNNPKDDPSLQVFMLCRGRWNENLRHLYNFKIEQSELHNLLYKSNYWRCKWSTSAQELNHKFDEKIYPIGSCKGLICLVVGQSGKTLYLWNPATQDSYFIKGPRLSNGSVLLSWGFGYLPLSDDYKILVLGKLNKLTSEPFAKIYTLRTNEWKRVEFPSDYEITDFMATKRSKTIRGEVNNSLPVLVGESLYWRKESVFYPKNILAFDLRRDLFEMIPLPKQDPSNIGHICEDFFICQIKQCLYGCWLWNECVPPRFRPTYYSRERQLYMTVSRMEGRVWKYLFKFTNLDRCFMDISLLPKLFELKEKGGYRYLISSWDLQRFLLIDPRGERHYPSKTVDLKSNFGKFDNVTCIFDYTPSLVSPTQSLVTSH